MLKQLRSNIPLIFLLNLFLFFSIDLNSQSPSIHYHVNIKTKKVKNNKYRTTVSIFIAASNKPKDKIKVKKSATGSTSEESKTKACAKANDELYEKVFNKKKGKGKKNKGNGKQVMLDENGEGDDKGGGEIVLIFGAGNEESQLFNEGDKNVETLRYENFEDFSKNAKNDIGVLLDKMPVEME